jgi:hypothetical protein
MPSLRCGHCEKLFEYREQIVALREANGGVVAELETELEAGTVEGAFQPVGKFHLHCYENDARARTWQLARVESDQLSPTTGL